MTSSRFAVAVHVLALLASSREEALSSEYIAGSVNTNPVVIRRLMVMLRAAGLVQTLAGRGGGFLLAVEPEDVTLLDIYRAVDERALIAIHNQPNVQCEVGRHIKTVLEDYTTAAARAMEASLQTVTLAAVVSSIGRLTSSETSATG
jgi:Rrf2 family protein